MENKICCDLAIIGAGAGGLSLAAGAAQLGAKVILIEAGKMGGDCLNYGCVPSKALLSAAKIGYQMKTAQAFGILAEKIQVDFKQVMSYVRLVINKIAPNDSIERFEGIGVQVIQASARFLNNNTLAAGENIIDAKKIVIATGSVPFIPPIPGLNKIKYLTNESIFNLTELPAHLLVIGGGPIGCELAQAFAMLGSQVTILEGAAILPKDDAECVDIVRQSLEKTGVTIYENTKITEITNGNTVKFIKNGIAGEVSGSHVLVATGRRACFKDLNLEKAGVNYTEKGLELDARLRTNIKNIYAIGDAAGSFQFTHIANYHAGVVLRNILFKLPAKVNYKAVPWVTYTLPEMAHVGVSTEKTQNPNHKIIESLYSENDRAQAEHEVIGKIKLVVNSKAKILGVTIVGANAGELILPWVMALRENKSLRSFTDVIVPYPTLSEISKRAAGQFYLARLFSKTTRRLVKFLSWFS